MTEPTKPIRTPSAPQVYELVPPGSSTPNGVAATCEHCDWSIVRPYQRGVRRGSSQAEDYADRLAKQCAEHARAHQDAYVAGVLRAAIGPLGSSEQAVQQLRVNGLLIVPDPDWKPAPEPAEVPA